MPFGPMEIAVVAVVVLFIFGPKRLPDVGRSIGGGMRSFKEAIGGEKDSAPDKREVEAPAKV